MFEREIKFIYDFNINQVKQLGTFFTFTTLSGLNIHPAILNYISAEIDYLIFEDRRKMLENSNFDYSSPQITSYFNLINQEIKKEKKLSFEYISNLMLHAVSFTINYLAQPKWSLSKLIFTKDYVMNVNDVKQILNYVYYYDYNKNIIDNYFLKKKIVSITKTELEQLLDKISSEIFSVQSTKMIDNALYAMAEFFNIGSVDKNKVPLLAIELFLKDKVLKEFSERLENAPSVESRSHFVIAELRKILYNPAPVKKGAYLDRILQQETPQVVFKQEEHGEKPPQKLKEEEIPPLKEEEHQKLEPVPAKPESENEITQETTYVDKDQMHLWESTCECCEKAAEKEIIDNPEIIPPIEIGQSPSMSSEYTNTGLEESKIFSTNENEAGELKVKLTSITEDIDNNKEENSGSLLEDTEEIKEDFKEIEEPGELQTLSEADFILEDFISEDKEKEQDVSFEEIQPDKSEDVNSSKKEEDSIITRIDEEIKSLDISPDYASEESGVDTSFQNPDIPPDQVKNNLPGDTYIPESKPGRKKIVDFMNRKQTRKILSAIFNEDREDFNNTIESLERCANYNEAINILDSLYKSYHIKPTLKEAVLLRNIVLEYYTQ